MELRFVGSPSSSVSEMISYCERRLLMLGNEAIPQIDARE